MYLKIGDVQFDTAAVGINYSVASEFSDTGALVSRTFTLNLRGTLKCDDGDDTQTAQARIKTRTQALEACFRQRNLNTVLYMDNGSESAVVLKAAGSLTGIQVVSGPNYPSTEGAECGTFRTWEATLQCKYPTGVNPDGTGTAEVQDTYAVTWQESVTRSGGRPERVLLPALNGPPQVQQTFALMPTVIVQAGQATGYRTYPPYPPPLYPLADKLTVRTGRTSPRQEGLLLKDFGISWEYQMEFALPPGDALPNFVLSPRA